MYIRNPTHKWVTSVADSDAEKPITAINRHDGTSFSSTYRYDLDHCPEREWTGCCVVVTNPLGKEGVGHRYCWRPNAAGRELFSWACLCTQNHKRRHLLDYNHHHWIHSAGDSARSFETWKYMNSARVAAECIMSHSLSAVSWCHLESVTLSCLTAAECNCGRCWWRSCACGDALAKELSGRHAGCHVLEDISSCARRRSPAAFSATVLLLLRVVGPPSEQALHHLGVDHLRS